MRCLPWRKARTNRQTRPAARREVSWSTFKQCSRRLFHPGHASASPQRPDARRRRGKRRHPGCSLPQPCCGAQGPQRSCVAGYGGCYWAPLALPAVRPGRRRPVAAVRSVLPVDGRPGRRCARGDVFSGRYTTERETKRGFRGTLGPHMVHCGLVAEEILHLSGQPSVSCGGSSGIVR